MWLGSSNVGCAACGWVVAMWDMLHVAGVVAMRDMLHVAG